MTNPIIRVFDKNGKLLAEAVAKSNARRISMRLPAWQRQLDQMYTPEAATAEIDSAKFRFDAKGRSQFHFVMNEV